jgi:type IV pilus assembly protein PilC
LATETFAYQVRDRSGQLLTGKIEGDSQAAVAARLRSQGLTPVSIEGGAAKGVKRELKKPWGNKVKLKQLAVFSRQFATMINSGLSLLRALNILAEQTESKVLAKVISQVRQDVEAGTALSVALARHPKTFSRLYIAMIRAGETGGVLDTVLVRLAETLEKQVALKQKIKSAMTYPVVVFVMVLLIVAGMLVFVVPMFKNLYAELGGTLPAPTRLLIGVSAVVTKYSYIVVGAAIGIGWGLRRYVASEKGRYQFDVLLLKAPVFGPLFHKVALSRFSRTLAVLMRSGVPILQALEIVSETVGNHVMSRAVIDVQQSVKEGESIARPLGSHKVFPPMVVQMLAVGEETGALDTMLSKVADFYDQEVEAMVEALTSLIEPILIAFMGAAVGSMVVALYMPMFQIINLIK